MERAVQLQFSVVILSRVAPQCRIATGFRLEARSACKRYMRDTVQATCYPRRRQGIYYTGNASTTLARILRWISLVPLNIFAAAALYSGICKSSTVTDRLSIASPCPRLLFANAATPVVPACSPAAPNNRSDAFSCVSVAHIFSNDTLAGNGSLRRTISEKAA